MVKLKFVKCITVNDPDTGGPVELEVYKHSNGALLAIDSSYLDQVCVVIEDPFYVGTPETMDEFRHPLTCDCGE